MSKTRIALGIGILAVIIMVVARYTATANLLDVCLDFETNSDLGTALYDNAYINWEMEDNGDHYINLGYNGNGNRGRTYCDVDVADISSSHKLIQAEYDMKCYETDITSRNNEIQFKYRTGHGSSETTVLARLAQIGEYFQIQNGGSFERVRGVNNSYLQIETDRWYSIKLAVDLTNHQQNLYIYDRETQELLAYKDNFATITKDLDYINMVTFSTSTEMALDNVRITVPIVDGLYLYGPTYLAKGETAKYKVFGLDEYSRMVVTPYNSAVLSIDTPRDGVSLDVKSGAVTVDSSAEPGQVVINVWDEDSNRRGQKIINISE